MPRAFWDACRNPEGPPGAYDHVLSALGFKALLRAYQGRGKVLSKSLMKSVLAIGALLRAY